MRVFDAHATTDRLPGAAFLEALRHRLAEAPEAARLQQSFPLDASAGSARLLLSATGTPGRRLLVKTASLAAAQPPADAPAHTPPNAATVRGQALLFDPHGLPLAQFDAAALGAAAAAATAALAADRLAPEGAARLALLGAGTLARAVPAALYALRPLREIVVWSRRAASAQALAAELADAGFATRVAASAREAVADAPLVVTATAAAAPVLQGDWLATQACVALLGGVDPGRSEADDTLWRRAARVVDGEAGLTALLRGPQTGAAGGVQVFRSAGSPLAELVAAEALVDAPVRPRPVRWHWEDFPVGQVRDCGRVQVRREAILAFAQQFDPQPFHLDDDAAARSLFGRLSASGWHTCAMAMRMMCEGYLLETASLGSPGIDNLRWLKPVLADDMLSLRMTVLAARPMTSKPDVGLTRSLWELHNQRGETVLSMEGWGMMRRRVPGADIDAAQGRLANKA